LKATTIPTGITVEAACIAVSTIIDHGEAAVTGKDIMTAEVTEKDDYVILYRRAFEKFGTRALWSSVPVPNPTRADALAITHSLRVEGDREARRLAEQIEQACCAAL
jgi:hypothetical protein